MLHTLYQRNVRARTQFFVEWMALDLIRDADGDVRRRDGARDGNRRGDRSCRRRRRCFATGGAGRIFAASTNAFINTGDGLGMAARAGIPLEDMEFWQFHPTGVAGAGVLITEGVRGEGGILLNANGERFMERYAPNLEGPGVARRGVSRSMDQEIKEGRGCGPNKDYVLLKLDHLGPERDRRSACRRSARSRSSSPTSTAIKEPIPVVPTIHYQMGGIPVNIHGQVVAPKDGNPNAIVQGLYAIGECACVSVHGANRLGTNFAARSRSCSAARPAISSSARISRPMPHKPLPRDAADMSRCAPRAPRRARRRANRCRRSRTNCARRCRRTAACSATRRCSPRASEGDGARGSARRARRSRIRASTFNTARVEALELDNLIETAKATIVSARGPARSRAAPRRAATIPNRDDANWLKHTLWYRDGNRLDYKPVNLKPLSVEAFPPKTRLLM